MQNNEAKIIVGMNNALINLFKRKMKIIGAVLYELCIELLYNFNQLYFTRKLNNHWFLINDRMCFSYSHSF